MQKQEDRGVAAQVGDVIDEIEERLFAPVDVVEHDDERRLHGDRLEQPAHRPGDLLDRRDQAAVAEHGVDRARGGAVQPELGEALLRLAPRSCLRTSTTGQYVMPSP